MCKYFDLFDDGDMLCDRNGVRTWIEPQTCRNCPFYEDEGKEAR